MLIKDYYNDTPNTPADDQWTLQFQYIQTYGSLSSSFNVPVTFLSTGAVDFTRTSTKDWETINELFSPLIVIVDVGSSVYGVNWNFWQLINWWFVGLYWRILVDLGQDSVTIYPPSTQSGRGFNPPDFSRATHYSSNNNIFVNNTLFSIYSDIMRNQIFPLGDPSYNRSSVSPFAPLDDENRFTPFNSSFQRSYSCVTRKWKAPLTALISVLVAVYALIKGGYTLLIFIAAQVQKRREQTGAPLISAGTNWQQTIAMDVFIID